MRMMEGEEWGGGMCELRVCWEEVGGGGGVGRSLTLQTKDGRGGETFNFLFPNLNSCHSRTIKLSHADGGYRRAAQHVFD